MKKNTLLIISGSIFLTGMITLSSCKKDTPPPAEAPAAVVPSNSFAEDFESVAAVAGKGWVSYNRSVPQGGDGWKTGVYELAGKYGGTVWGFPAYNAKTYPQEYAACENTVVNDLGGISCWLITPKVSVKNGDVLSFYSRSQQTVPDRMQVRANFVDGSTDIGTGLLGVGKFTTILTDINAALAGTGYPAVWTKYTITISGLTAPVPAARFAFRYFIETNAGNSGANGDLIGVDAVQFTSN
jgi:hypothetical protein